MRPPSLRRDAGAAIDIPFKLLLSLVVIGLALGVLMPALSAYQTSEVEHRLSVTLAEIEAAALSVHRHPGSSRTVVIDLVASGSVRLEWMEVGGELSGPLADMASIRWRHTGGASGKHLVSTSSGPLPMAGPDGGPLTIGSFPCMLVLEALPSPDGCPCPSFVSVIVV